MPVYLRISHLMPVYLRISHLMPVCLAESITVAYAAATTQGPTQASRAFTGPKNQQQQQQQQKGVLLPAVVLVVVRVDEIVAVLVDAVVGEVLLVVAYVGKRGRCVLDSSEPVPDQRMLGQYV